jgi:hypothetical protein
VIIYYSSGYNLRKSSIFYSLPSQRHFSPMYKIAHQKEGSFSEALKSTLILQKPN